jgi:hypothetical protein
MRTKEQIQICLPRSVAKAMENYLLDYYKRTHYKMNQSELITKALMDYCHLEKFGTIMPDDLKFRQSRRDMKEDVRQETIGIWAGKHPNETQGAFSMRTAFMKHGPDMLKAAIAMERGRKIPLPGELFTYQTHREAFLEFKGHFMYAQFMAQDYASLCEGGVPAIEVDIMAMFDELPGSVDCYRVPHVLQKLINKEPNPYVLEDNTEKCD